jgi:hypothetical protein
MSLAPIGWHSAISVLEGLLAGLLCIVLHEAGHLLAGLASGSRLEFLVIGPLALRRGRGGRLQAGWNRDPALAGGAAAALPVHPGGLRLRFAITCAGGPVASLLLALVAHAVLVQAPGVHGFPRAELAWIRLLSVLLGLVNCIPMSNGPFVTDGERMRRILDRGPRGDRELSLLRISQLQAAGVRPGDWDPAILARGLAVRDGSMFECQMNLWAHAHAVEHGRRQDAAALLERARATSGRAPLELRAELARAEVEFTSRPPAPSRDHGA